MNNQQKQPFDPWTATEEERQAVYNDGVALFEKNGTLPRNHEFSKLVAWCKVVELEEGAPFTGWQILNAVNDCLMAEITAPEWLFREYNKRLNLVRFHGKGWSDSEVFGPERPKYARSGGNDVTEGYLLDTAIKESGLPKIRGHNRDKLNMLAERLNLGTNGSTAEKKLTAFRKAVKKLTTIKP
jgi:hypothetical protein